MNSAAICRHVQQIEPLAKAPDQRRNDKRCKGRNKEKDEVGFQGSLTFLFLARARNQRAADT
jgi:hypothetical protein